MLHPTVRLPHLALVLLVSLALTADAGAFFGKKKKKNKPTIHIEYTEPAKVGLPENLTSIAILPFTQAIEDKENVYTDRERKWGDHIIAAVAAKMQEYARDFDMPLKLADRESVAAIMKEKDLADAGLAEENQALQLGKLAQTQAICYGKVVISIDSVEGQVKTVEFRPGGYGVAPSTTYKKRIKRTINTAVDFKLVSVANGRSIHTFASNRSQTVDLKPGAIMGKDYDEADLQPETDAIGAMLTELVDEFVAQILPHKVAYDVPLADPKKKMAKSATRLLRSGEYQDAIELFQRSLTEEDDDHRAMYNLAVTYEVSGGLPKALDYYKMAFADKDEEMYLAGLTRVKGLLEKRREALAENPLGKATAEGMVNTETEAPASQPAQ
ncbi:MAG: tetratricopeptide repeat protein [Phycisphaerae bacterium]|nr:tetratricopeptide repeat protein [Phycisphaerae bacterium]